jgi:ribonuclease Z
VVADEESDLAERAPRRRPWRPDAAWNRVLAHHTSPEEAGTVFTLAAPKMAVFCHYTLMGGGQGGREVTPEQAVERARKTYDGPLVAGEDLMSFEIGETVVMKKFGA